MKWILLAALMTTAHATDAARDAGVFGGRMSSGTWHAVKWAQVASTVAVGVDAGVILAKSKEKPRDAAKIIALGMITRAGWQPVYWKVARGRWIDLRKGANLNAIPAPFGPKALGGVPLLGVWLGPSALGAAVFWKL